MHDMDQRSQEWLEIRLGKATASRVADIMAKGRSGAPSASRANYAAQLVCERLTGQPTETFTSSAMQWGTDNEGAAREAYEFMLNVNVEQVGFVDHPELPRTGASPDGLVGEHGMLEIKAPNTATHIETLVNDKIAERYITQIQWQLACSGRRWADFVSFDPRMPTEMQLYVKRIPRDEARINELETEVAKFLKEVDATVDELNARYRPITAPDGWVNPLAAG